MMPVEGCCLVTLGVHQQGEGRDFGTRCAVKGISPQGRTQALPLEARSAARRPMRTAGTAG